MCMFFFTLKYQFQDQSNSTLTYNKTNGSCFFLTLSTVLRVYYDKWVRNSAKKNGFMTATNALLSIVLTTVNFTVLGSKIAKIQKLYTVVLMVSVKPM